MNAVASAALQGRELVLAEPVQAGDILRIGDQYVVAPPGAPAPFNVHVVWARGTGPCEVVLGDPWPYAGLGWVPRPVAAGEPVKVVSTSRSIPDEQPAGGDGR